MKRAGKSCDQSTTKKPKLDKPPKNGEGQDSPRDHSWRPEELLSQDFNIDFRTSQTVCRLLDEGNSIPFLARYRREMTGGLEPDQLRNFKESMETLRAVQDKCTKHLAALEKSGKVSNTVRRSLLSATTHAELEHAYAPFKTGSKATLAEKARKLGLEEVAMEILEGKKSSWNLASYVTGATGRSSAQEIETGIQHIIADVLVHSKDMADFIRDLQAKAQINIESKKAAAGKAQGKGDKGAAKGKQEDPAKFETYFNFTCPLRFVKPHQTLALNRGEALKIISVKINLPDNWLLGQLERETKNKWLSQGLGSSLRTKIVMESVRDAYKRLIAPKFVRTVRGQMTQAAEAAAIQSFVENLRQLLLTPPFRGEKILSIDPGFSHGCKIAAISETGDVLDSAVIYPRFRDFFQDRSEITKLANLIKKHSICSVAIGNGTASLETQKLISAAIENKCFEPLEVKYAVVEERGASIYSCSPIAVEEFPKMEKNIISAISIGRRLQDPLSEYVKIEPHHLGVGMYQHDIQQKKLQAALEEIVVECVSFVGVDLNSCSEYLLRRVAGLTPARAKAIIEYRKKNGGFKSRDELKSVKTIGAKVFTQCAGFIRIRHKGSKPGKDFHPLDMTEIHPESYQTANRLLTEIGCQADSVGEAAFVAAVKSFASTTNLEGLATRMGVGLPTLEQIVASLQKPKEHDYRQEFGTPLFRSGLTSINDVAVGDQLTGKVSNVLDFGAFVDVGLGRDGLIHVSKMKGRKLELGNRVEVKLVSKDMERGRIGLELINTV